MKQEQERQKILQAQLELEKLAKQQEELEKQHHNDSAIKAKEDELKLEILSEEDQYQQNSNEYEQYLKQQQELLNQFFGFNLGPVLTSHLPPPQTKQSVENGTSKSQQITSKRENNNNNTKSKVDSTTSKKAEPAKKESTKVKSEAKVTKNASKEKPTTPVLKVINGPSDGLRKHHSPSLEDVEDEESILFRKRFDH